MSERTDSVVVSALFTGVGEDAEHLARLLAARA